MPALNLVTPALLFLWAGLSLGGNLIAAPAKFGAQNIPIEHLLQIGQLQFRWLANAEWVLLGLCLAATIFTSRTNLLWLAIPIALFLIQRFAVFPELDARTIQTIAGNPPAPSNIHLIYIGLEIAKFVMLIGVAALFVRRAIT